MYAQDPGNCYDVEVNAAFTLTFGYNKEEQKLTFKTSDPYAHVDVDKGFWCTILSLATLGIWQLQENKAERMGRQQVEQILNSRVYGDVANILTEKATDSLGRLKESM